MSTSNQTENRVRAHRLARGWSQAELALRAGISRAAVSAIEGSRLVPSVAAALALAGVLDSSVEQLFGVDRATQVEAEPCWAWQSSPQSKRYWSASLYGRMLIYPAEPSPLGELPHDGVGRPQPTAQMRQQAEKTLVLAGCDPAAGLLARLYEQQTGYRMLVFSRSSRQALQLLKQGLVHVAGVHLAGSNDEDGNVNAVMQFVNEPSRLVRLASWNAGIAVGSGVKTQSVRGLLQSRLTWIGREPGSGARQCLDELLEGRPSPKRIARDHRGVALAIECGAADAGVCLQLVAEEAGLQFHTIRTEGYDLCHLRTVDDDPRIVSLLRLIRSQECRQLIGDLPGYDTRHAGDESAFGAGL